MASRSRTKRKASSLPERQNQPPEPPHNPIIPSSSSSLAADNLCSPSTQPLVFPVGYRFVPEDEELISHYLIPFLQGNEDSWLNVPIHRANIYESNPQQLSEEYMKGNMKEWFFVSEITKHGKNKKRGDNSGGCWHSTTAAEKVNSGQGVVGYKSKLEYYAGKPPNKGDWLMQEYWVKSSDDNVNKVDYVLCKIYLTPTAEEKKKKEEKEKLKKADKEEKKKLKKADEEEKEKLKKAEGVVSKGQIDLNKIPEDQD